MVRLWPKNFFRNPKKIHVLDISENIVELVRDIRSSFGYIKGEFKTYCIDFGGIEFENLMNNNCYDIRNLAALKHVRSEKDVYTISRMIDVNIFNTVKSIKLSNENLKNYFVSLQIKLLIL